MYVLHGDTKLITIMLKTIQAETSGGGLALWGSDGSIGAIRTADETYHQAWLPWVTQVGQIIAANQITEGGVSS